MNTSTESGKYLLPAKRIIAQIFLLLLLFSLSSAGLSAQEKTSSENPPLLLQLGSSEQYVITGTETYGNRIYYKYSNGIYESADYSSVQNKVDIKIEAGAGRVAVY